MSTDAARSVASSDSGEAERKEKKIPVITERGLSRAADRAQAQAEALRANLARRKAQSRARGEE